VWWVRAHPDTATASRRNLNKAGGHSCPQVFITGNSCLKIHSGELAGQKCPRSKRERMKKLLLPASILADVLFNQRKSLSINHVPAKGPNNAAEEPINGSDL